MSTIRVGIWGAGAMARQHAQRLASHEDVAVVGIAARNHDAAREVAAEAQIVGDVDALLRDVGIDVLYACVPPGVHGGEIEAAAAAGVHCFMEKPLARTWERMTSIATAIERHGVTSQVGFHLRFQRGVAQARALAATGEAGRAVQFLGRYWARMDGSAWWRDPGLGGGQCFEQAIHCYDLACHLFGPVDRVSAYLATLGHGSDYQVDDVSTAMLHFANGALGSINATTCAIPQRFIGDWRAAWSACTIDATADGDWRTVDETRIYHADGDGSPTSVLREDRDCYAAETSDFLDAIRNGHTTRCPVSDALPAHATVLAVHASARAGGQPVCVEHCAPADAASAR